jgi:hypothetical protein
VHLPLRFLSTHLGTRLGALGLCRRLSLHLPLESCDEAATSPLARFTVLVGGCSLLSLPTPTVRLVLCDVGSDPASFKFACGWWCHMG